MLRPFPQYSGVNDVYGDVTNSNYNSLQITLIQRRSNGLTINANYKFAKTIDGTGGTRSAYNWKTEKAVSMTDQTHVLNGVFVYQLPFGKGRRQLWSDWQISNITQFRTGVPLGPFTAPCNLSNAGSCYADYNPDFSSSFNQDVSVRREFPIRERVHFLLQGDAFNIFNNVRFTGISVDTTSSNFGKVSREGNTPRVLQFAAKITF